MYVSDLSTYSLLLLLGSRERRQAAWTEDRRNRRAVPAEHNSSIDDAIVVDVAEVLAERIDAARKNQPDF